MILTPLAGIVGNISTDGIDMILGLTILGTGNFAIDYDRHQVIAQPASLR